jgi:NRAMP (natural resistance-associated macrophage protein)-like metal ion transporter
MVSSLPTAEAQKTTRPSFWSRLGPGLVTGASDDDPSGIATYSQVGAQFGYGMLWTMVVSYPLMAAIQEICACIGRVTGSGIASNLRSRYPKWLLYAVVSIMLIANTFNLGADIGAMGAAAQLLLPGSVRLYIVVFGVVSLLLQLLIPYTRYVKYLKWLTLSPFAYVASAFFAHVPWRSMPSVLLHPHMEFTKPYLTALVAVMGTTISPYLFSGKPRRKSKRSRTIAERRRSSVIPNKPKNNWGESDSTHTSVWRFQTLSRFLSF